MIGLLPEVASAHGAGLDRVTLLVHLLAFVLLAIWGTIFVVALVRFRAGRQAAEGPVDEAPGRRWPTVLEVSVVVVEAAILLGLALPLFSARLDSDAGSDALEVRIVAQQYAWNVHYPGPDGVFGPTDPSRVDEATNPIGLDRDDPRALDDVVLQNQLHLEVDRPVRLRMTSKDVIHSFSVVELRVKRDIVPGTTTEISFVPTITTADLAARLERPEFVYEIGCAQLCGLGHARMRGVLTVHDADGWRAWMAERQEMLRRAREQPVDDFWS